MELGWMYEFALWNHNQLLSMVFNLRFTVNFQLKIQNRRYVWNLNLVFSFCFNQQSVDLQIDDSSLKEEKMRKSPKAKGKANKFVDNLSVEKAIAVIKTCVCI
ncbi:hypothetical protein MKW98_013129 [Papaver atlanticum]|uniref:Uncharacterized protein n=1 Tax=Papaver atlanticum TaxID=357466 RepID=A0AAD4T8I8_9MAGN|nr:hypothetical protein MKW98_013129 [Papaver atlanticum]